MASALGTISFSTHEPVFLNDFDYTDWDEPSLIVRLWTYGYCVAFAIQHIKDSYPYFELWIYNWKTGEEIVVRVHGSPMVKFTNLCRAISTLHKLYHRSL